MFDEFLVPDFDPTERKSIAEYLALFKVAFDPHDTIIRNHKNANRIANNMVNVDGYSVEQMYSVVDEAREFYGLEKIERVQQSAQPNNDGLVHADNESTPEADTSDGHLPIPTISE